MNLFEELQRKFDHIFLLNLSTRTDRRDIMLKQLSEFGLKDNYTQTDLDIHYATPFPHNGLIMNAINASKKGKFTKPNEYDCARNHYAMVKQAYDHGYKHCLILEDDIRLSKNSALWEYYLNNLPEDWDILQFGGFTANPIINNYLEPGEWVTHREVGVWNTSMYALSRKGMQYYLAFMDKILWVADGPVYKAPLNDKLIKTYLASDPLVIQEDKTVDPSDIRDEQNDDIDYNTENVYEHSINRSDFWQNA